MAAAVERARLATALAKDADETARDHASTRWAATMARDADLGVDADDDQGAENATATGAAVAKRKRKRGDLNALLARNVASRPKNSCVVVNAASLAQLAAERAQGGLVAERNPPRAKKRNKKRRG